MRLKTYLAGAAAALCLTAAAAAPASAADIANPVGTSFGGSNATPWVFSIGGTALQVRCNTVAINGSAAAGRGVQPNAIGGPSTRMARFLPTFSNCTMQLGTLAPKPARVVAWCDWAYAVDGFNSVNGQSRERLAIGLQCQDPNRALTLDDGTCTVQVPAQVFITNGANINIIGQNTPAPPALPTAISINNSINQAIARTVNAGCAPVTNPAPPASMAGTFNLNAPGIWAS
jgi:hypothetical protein